MTRRRRRLTDALAAALGITVAAIVIGVAALTAHAWVTATEAAIDQTEQGQ